MITEKALARLEQIAESVGFGPREDYPHLGASRVSAGDWKGDSVAACVFAYPSHADAFCEKVLSSDLTAWGSDEIRHCVFQVETPRGGQVYVAVIAAVDLATTADEEADPHSD